VTRREQPHGWKSAKSLNQVDDQTRDNKSRKRDRTTDDRDTKTDFNEPYQQF
jgi:hypothetical protein